MSSFDFTDLRSKAHNASKWSLLTEVIARAITPVTQLLLARLLEPQAFGVIAAVVMVTSFAGMLTDAGFGKFLVQRAVKNDNELSEYANVSFWSSLALGLSLFTIIVLLREPIALLLGDESLSVVLVVISLGIPLTVCVSTQTALFRRALEFKKLLPIRIGATLTTFIVTVPLALLGAGYWSLVAGILISTLVTAIAINVVSPWKPSFFYSFSILRKMFAFSGWSLLESASIWLSAWVGVFIVANLLGAHELGLYRQPITVVTAMFAIITAATTPVLFSTLSRLQHDSNLFRAFFFNFQFGVAVFVLPLGVGAFFFRDFLTEVLFGSQWTEAALMFGVWSLSTGFMIVFSHYCSEIYRALGKPKISLISQTIYLSVAIPALYISALHGFVVLVIASGLLQIVLATINQILTYIVAGISFPQVIRNLIPALVAVFAMASIAVWLAPLTRFDWSLSIAAIVACAVVYLAVGLCFPRMREYLLTLLSMLRRNGGAP